MTPTVVHLTDLHLYADGEQRLKGVQTLASFRAVQGMARRMVPHPDLLLLGGDLAQDETAQSYRRLARELAGWCATVRVTPGNHCDPPTMERALFPPLEIPPLAEEGGVRLGPWMVVPLNSHDGSVAPAGRLGAPLLERLERLLRDPPAEHLLLAMHHHPVTIDCPWMDAMMLEDADDFWHLVDASRAVRAVLFGHVHQELDRWRGAVRLLATPATSIQFLPRSRRFELDPRAPGFRLLTLHGDGTITTTVHRVEGFLPDLHDTGFY